MTGAPNEYFSENEPLTTEIENLDAFKAFSSAFLCCWKEFICSLFPAGYMAILPGSRAAFSMFTSQKKKKMSVFKKAPQDCLKIATLIRVYTVKIHTTQLYLSLVNQE